MFESLIAQIDLFAFVVADTEDLFAYLDLFCQPTDVANCHVLQRDRGNDEEIVWIALSCAIYRRVSASAAAAAARCSSWRVSLHVDSRTMLDQFQDLLKAKIVVDNPSKRFEDVCMVFAKSRSTNDKIGEFVLVGSCRKFIWKKRRFRDYFKR